MFGYLFLGETLTMQAMAGIALVIAGVVCAIVYGGRRDQVHAWEEIKGPLTWPIMAMTALTGFIALAVGMTLLLFALSGGKVGIVSTLSATSPVIILPMIWLRTGQRPAAGAWFGAALVVAGMALLFVR